MKYKYKTIVISDVHLGRKDSKVDEVVSFLKNNPCENLFLNGDIIDGWHLKRGGKWTKKHTKFITKVLKLISNNKTNVYYLRGNHDDFLNTISPLLIGDKFKLENDYIYESNGRKYLIMHGDVFDHITSKIVWLSKLGDIGYEILLWINRSHNKKRAKKGLPYKSMSQIVKEKVKLALNFLLKFEERAIEFAINKNCDGIICGHVHTPIIKIFGSVNVIYMNSGDWVETKSALVEKYNGKWEIIYYDKHK